MGDGMRYIGSVSRRYEQWKCDDRSVSRRHGRCKGQGWGDDGSMSVYTIVSIYTRLFPTVKCGNETSLHVCMRIYGGGGLSQ